MRTYESTDWKLIIVGDGPELEYNKNLVKEYGLEKHIEFTGYQNPEEYYKKASIFAMTSSQEGFPMSIIEAQSFGVVPVVMNTSPAYETIIFSGENGVIIPNYDVKAFTETLFLLMQDEEQRMQMAKSAMLLSNRFNVKKIADKWESLFSKLLRERNESGKNKDGTIK